MLNKKITKIATGVITPAILFLGMASVTLADDSGSETSSIQPIRLEKQLMEKKNILGTKGVDIAKEIGRGQEAVDKRIEDLSALKERLSQMKNLSDTSRAELLAQIDAQIATLNELKTKIGNNTEVQALRQDLSSITKDNRIYMDFQPKVKILATADRSSNLIGMMNALVPKLEERINSAQTAGKDVASLVSALSDLKAKLAEATEIASKIPSSVSGITPDGGDKNVMSANLQALKDARANVKALNDTLKAANKDIKTITSGLRAISPKTGDRKPETDNRINNGDSPSGNGSEDNSNSAQ